MLDLGCGAGGSVDVFRARDPDVQWVGLDVPGSPEARERTRTDARFETFDGVSMPFEDGAFDLVYCKQVLEHVRRSRAAARRGAPGARPGRMVRRLDLPARALSLAQPVELHPRRHSSALLEHASLRPVELRPGIDGLTLIAWRLAGNHRCFHRWWGRESPLNRALNACGRVLKADPRTLNATKLLFCGQFAFLAQRAGEPT